MNREMSTPKNEDGVLFTYGGDYHCLESDFLRKEKPPSSAKEPANKAGKQGKGKRKKPA
jgi:hypothetical protein